MTVPMPCSDDEDEIKTVKPKQDGTQMIVDSLRRMNEAIERSAAFLEEQDRISKRLKVGQYREN